MRNRFENYISNGYVSQFVPTPIDTNLLYNVQKEKQAYLDNLHASLAKMKPEFNFIHANEYDMGHTQEAQSIKDYYANQSTEISKMLQEDNLSGAKQAMLSTLYNEDMNKKMQYLEYAYNQDLANIKSLEDIKNLDDRNLASNHYQKERLKNKNFDDYYAGKSSPLNSPLLSDNPDLEDLINQAGAAINANGYTTSDGGVLYAAKDAQGNPTGKYMYRKGDVTSEITGDRAYNLISVSVLANPKVQSYAAARKAWGSPIEQQLDLMIQSQAGARAHRKSNQDVSYTNMEDGFQTQNPLGSDYTQRTPSNSKHNAKVQGNDGFKYENGKMYKRVQNTKNIVTGKEGAEHIANEYSWEEVPFTEADKKSITTNYMKIIDQNGNAKVISKGSKDFYLNQGWVEEPMSKEELQKVYSGLMTSTQSVSWSTTQPSEKDVKNKYSASQLAALGHNSQEVRKMGKDGTITYDTQSTFDIADKEFIPAGMTINHPQYGFGYQTYVATDEDGNQYEYISNKVDKELLPLKKVIDGLTAYQLNPQMNEPTVIQIGDGYAIVNKDTELDQDQQGNYSTQTVPEVNITFIDANSMKDAKEQLDTGNTKTIGSMSLPSYIDMVIKNNQ